MNYKPIDPEIKSVSKIFDIKKPYFIDIYQREYTWSKESTLELLRDIEQAFSLNKTYYIV
ncbi:MAG: hypothetical protein ACRCV0_07925 [Brevinema sp.]